MCDVWGLLGMIALAPVGLLITGLSAPTVASLLAGTGVVPGLSAMVSFSVRHVGAPFSAGSTALTPLWFAVVAWVPVGVILLTVAAIIQSFRQSSALPLGAAAGSFAAGLVLCPLLAWLIQLLVWGFWLWSVVSRWWGEVGPAIISIGAVVLGICIAVIAVLTIVADDWEWSLLIPAAVSVVLLLAGLSWLFGEWGTPWLQDLARPVAAFFAPVGDFLGMVVRVCLRVIAGVMAWVFAVPVLAYVGSAVVSPIRSAVGCTKTSVAMADTGGGIGIAVGILLMKASYDAGWARKLSQLDTPINNLLPWDLPSLLDIRLDFLMPAGFHDQAAHLFQGFDITIDVVVAAIALILAILVTFFSQEDMEASGVATLVTLGFLQLPVVLALTMWLAEVTRADST